MVVCVSPTSTEIGENRAEAGELAHTHRVSSLPQGALRALIGEDLAEGEFLERFWGKAPYVAKAASRSAKGLYSAERFWERAFVSEIDAAKRSEGEEQEQFRIQPEQVEALFGAGFTVCGNVSHDPVLAPLLIGIKSRLSLLGGPSFAKVYASPQGGGFALHTDPHHVFVIQLAGKEALAVPVLRGGGPGGWDTDQR